MVMPDEHNPEHEADQPAIYQIRIKGYLSQHRMDWFDGLTVTLEEDGNTLLTGPILDQAALHGILKKIRDLGLPLLSVNSVGTTPEDTSGANDQKAGDS
jgi:hypothetical protein